MGKNKEVLVLDYTCAWHLLHLHCLSRAVYILSVYDLTRRNKKTSDSNYNSKSPFSSTHYYVESKKKYTKKKGKRAQQQERRCRREIGGRSCQCNRRDQRIHRFSKSAYYISTCHDRSCCQLFADHDSYAGYTDNLMRSSIAFSISSEYLCYIIASQ